MRPRSQSAAGRRDFGPRQALLIRLEAVGDARELRLTATFDGETTIDDVPLRALFGTHDDSVSDHSPQRGAKYGPESEGAGGERGAFGQERHSGAVHGFVVDRHTDLLRDAGEVWRGGLCYTFFPMPFERTATLTLRHNGTAGRPQIPRVRFATRVADRPPPLAAAGGAPPPLLFRVAHRALSKEGACDMGTHEVVSEPAGAGRLVGMLLDMHASGATIEGDPVVSWDGARSPQLAFTSQASTARELLECCANASLSKNLFIYSLHVAARPFIAGGLLPRDAGVRA